MTPESHETYSAYQSSNSLEELVVVATAHCTCLVISKDQVLALLYSTSKVNRLIATKTLLYQKKAHSETIWPWLNTF
jgi:hypothetical protein